MLHKETKLTNKLTNKGKRERRRGRKGEGREARTGTKLCDFRFGNDFLVVKPKTTKKKKTGLHQS